MRDLKGLDAFEALERLLAGQEQEPWRTDEPAIDRLRAALGTTRPLASPLDLAVLLRQALRYEYARRGHQANPQLVIANERLSAFEGWELVGLSAIAEGYTWKVSAKDWRPDWLKLGSTLGVDDQAASENVQRRFGAEDCDGDPFLQAIGRKSYRSSGQRAAVRAALSTPPGASLVIALPTGEGKSMIFQLIQAIGFIGDDVSATHGITLVIVPTVALGMNHEAEAVDVCNLTKPLAYQSGAEAANALIADQISQGVQRLCFASPEAACGPLRSSLREATQKGFLRAIVVDEAHLVDQWGTGFRTEFQELSGLRRELMTLAPKCQEPRTILLSATLTDSSLETLRALFGGEGGFESCAAVRLRPEPDYWVATPNQAHREARVLEAMHHIPRPAVIYVTEVKEAERWHAVLRRKGFGRVGMLHGSTRRAERERVVSQWRTGALDIVVGTSAFGLGIDFAHARSVLHACVPETLDRFYQEVGRGGRDGRSSLSLIIPAPSDFATAKGLNQQQIITVERGFARWKAMFEGKRMLGGADIAVRVDGSPGTSDVDIDMQGNQNTDWNLRTLALMARAGLVHLHGAPHPAVTVPGDWFVLEILDDGHLQKDRWRQKIEPVRHRSHLASARNLQLMEKFLEDKACPADIFETLYGPGRVSKVCSRCSVCRANPSLRRPAKPAGEPNGPWRIPLRSLLARLLDSDGRLLVIYHQDQTGLAGSRRLGDTIARLQRAGLAKLILLGEPPFDMKRVLLAAETTPMFVSKLTSLAKSRLPPGPELIIVGLNQKLGQASTDPRLGRARILIVPEDQSTLGGRRLRDVFGGRVLALEEFNGRVAL